MVSASAADGKSDTVKFYGQTMYRGWDGGFVIECRNLYSDRLMDPVKWNTTKTYYVTLTSVSYRIPGVPYTFTTAVGQNDLVFRPYTSAMVKASDYTINFRGCIFDTNQEIRKSQSYAGVNCRANYGQYYHLKCSLNSSSVTDTLTHSGRFTP